MARRLKEKNSGRFFLRLRLQVAIEYQDICIAALLESGCEGFEQDSDELIAWISKERYTRKAELAISSWLEDRADICRLLDRQIVPMINWNKEWEKSIRPQRTGRFYIYPSWSKDKVPDGYIPITIDPKMSFGTGYHETTRLMLHLLNNHFSGQPEVLDMGMGTGILAIAAAKLGARQVLGIDIDPCCFENATENVCMNGVGESVTLKTGSTEQLSSDENFDLILANINKNFLLKMAETLIGHLSEQGVLIISGILEQDREEIQADPFLQKLELLQLIRENEWIAMAFLKSAEHSSAFIKKQEHRVPKDG